MAGRKAVNMAGQRFGKLVVLCRAAKKGSDARWVAQCDCGTVLYAVRRFNLLAGQASCGCARPRRS